MTPFTWNENKCFLLREATGLYFIGTKTGKYAREELRVLER
jgi:hypothetical protein